MSKAYSEPTDRNTERKTPPEGAITTRTGGWVRPWRKGENGNPGGVHGEYYRVRKLCAGRSTW